MEDVLDLYERPYDPMNPVVCLDERPAVLHEDTRPASAVQPHREARYDYEYQRNGTANVFCAVEPLAGKHLIKATANRKGDQFAHMLEDIAANYPHVQTIHLVLDNLNTHCQRTLVKHLGSECGESLWNRFTVHYTPIHGSWLNQAEIEIGVLNQQCLAKRRIPTLALLQQETAAWAEYANATGLRFRWGFTTAKARKTFGYERVSSRGSPTHEPDRPVGEDSS